MTDTIPDIPDDRKLQLAGAANFRDLGGNPTIDSRLVKRGLVFRSDHLSRLSPGDHSILQRMQLKIVCDLRSVQEQQKAPDLLPDDASIRLLSLPVQDKIFDPATAMERLKAGDDTWLSMDFLVGLYRRYLDDFGPTWGRVLSFAAADDNLPLVFHCTGGKDRTGICAALLLKTLGVQEEHILSDHLLSDVCNAERLEPLFARFAALGIDAQRAGYYLQAPVEPLIALFDHLKKVYGTAEDYLIKKGGLERATLSAIRARLLQ
jgi:protein-tyrosine phosphatase